MTTKRMKKKIKDTSPKFIARENYAIGMLQKGAATNEVPERFSKNNVYYFSGSQLLERGIKTANEFLSSAGCGFDAGSSVLFYNVTYGADEDKTAAYTHIYTGTVFGTQQTLSDDNSNERPVTIQNLIPSIPSAGNTANDKMWFKSQSEQIQHLQELAAKERSENTKERKELNDKILDLNDKILALNIQINTLTAEKEALSIRYEESQKTIETLKELLQGEEETEPEQPAGLADKGVAMIDTMLGDGASQAIIAGLAGGIGEGIGKLINIGADYIAKKTGTGNNPQPAVNNLQQPNQEAKQNSQINNLTLEEVSEAAQGDIF